MDKDTAATQDQVPQLLCRTGHEREDGDQEVYQAKENAYIWHLGASSSPSSPDTIRRERRTNGKYRIAATVHCCCCCLLKTVLDRYKKIIKKKSSYMLTSFGFFLFNGSRQSVQKSHGFHL